MATKALQSLTDDALLLRLAELLRDSRRVEADLVAHIAEVDARGLYLREACSSMFSYCVERLRLSEPETGLRIHVARASRRHPVLLQMLRDGRMHLSGVAVLAPHLTEDNRDRVLARAAHRTKAQLLELIAEIAPRPDVRPSMRKLPTRVADNELGHSPGSTAFSWSAGSAAGIDARAPQFFGHGLDDVGYPGDGGPAALPVEHRLDDVAPPGVAVPTGTGSRALEDDALPGDVGPSAGIRSPVCRPLILARPTDRPARSGHVIEPLAPGRYRVQFTAGAPLRAKLERLQVLMARAVPDGDLAVLIEAAVTERIERLESQRLRGICRAFPPPGERGWGEGPSASQMPLPVSRRAPAASSLGIGRARARLSRAGRLRRRRSAGARPLSRRAAAGRLRSRPVRAPLVLGLLVIGLFLGLMLWATEGHFVAQVSDLYVVAQYARAFAEGHPFRYNAGEAPTSGSTSLLHTVLLAGADRAGARGEGLIAAAVGLGAVFYLASIVLAGRVTGRLAGPREAALGAALVALCGPVVWGYLYGSDIALFLLLALLLLERWLAFWEGGSVRSVAAAGGLLALARPEGLPIAILLAAAGSRRPGPRRAERLWLLAPVAAGLSVLLLQRVVTGSWLATSVAEKALLPNYGPVQTLMAASRYGVDVLRGLLLGLYPPEARIGFARGEASFVFPPLALLLVLLALSQTGKAAVVPARLWLAVVALVFALTGPNVFMGVHFNRYLMWAFPGLIAFAAAGVGVLTRLAARGDETLERNLFRGAAGLLLLLGALSTAHFAGVYAALAGETWRREIPMAAFIREQLPPGVAIANVATSVEYLTGHRNLNPHGVTSPGFAGGRTLEREASMFESLSRIERAARPPYILLTRAAREGSPLLQQLAPEPELFATSSFSDDLVLHRASWEVLDGSDEPAIEASRRAVAGLQRTDRLDVCDPADEAAHGYRVETRRGDLLIGGAVAIGPVSADPAARPLADAGRVVMGRERFRVGTRTGRDLVIVLRTRSEAVATFMRADGAGAVELSMPEAGVVVASGGRDIGRFVLRNTPGWNEHVLRVPAAAVGAGGNTELELRGRYAAFHYWFYQ